MPTLFMVTAASNVRFLAYTVSKAAGMKIWGYFPPSLSEVGAKADLLISENWKIFLTGKTG